MKKESTFNEKSSSDVTHESFDTLPEQEGDEKSNISNAERLVNEKLRELGNASVDVKGGEGKLRNTGLRQSLEDIRATLEPSGEDQDDRTLNLMSAYQGIEEITKTYGQAGELEDIKQAIMGNLREQGIEGVEGFSNLDTEFQEASADVKEAMKKGPENMSEQEAAEAVGTVEQYLHLKGEIKKRQQEITGGSKSFYSEVSRKVAERIGSYLTGVGERIDEKLITLNPSNAILRAAKKMGEHGKAASFSRHAALGAGALAGLVFLVGRPEFAESAGQSEVPVDSAGRPSLEAGATVGEVESHEAAEERAVNFLHRLSQIPGSRGGTHSRQNELATDRAVETMIIDFALQEKVLASGGSLEGRMKDVPVTPEEIAKAVEQLNAALGEYADRYLGDGDGEVEPEDIKAVQKASATNPGLRALIKMSFKYRVQ